MAAENEHTPNPDDEMRLCPTCRMKVSVWATKCHYCGEEVGRPRKEELKLTLKDLGGLEKTTYAPSGNVTGALESFRVEEASNTEALLASRRKVGFFARLMGKQPPPPPPKAAPPGLDEYSRNLSASILDDIPASTSMSISRSQLPRQTGSDLVDKLKLLGIVVVALAVLYFGGNYAWARISDYLDARNHVEEFVYPNKALEMLARGEEPIVAFEEAMTALGHNNTEENRQIAGDIRKLVLQEVDDLMKQNPWNRANHDKAAAIIQRALNVDNSEPVRRKFESVSHEAGLYKFVLKSVNDAGTEATFRLNNPDYEPEETKEVGDRLMDRFIVVRITSREVDLNDDMVPGRKLSIEINKGVRSKY